MADPASDSPRPPTSARELASRSALFAPTNFCINNVVIALCSMVKLAEDAIREDPHADDLSVTSRSLKG